MVDGVVVRWEERTVVPELVVVGEHDGRVLAHQVELAIGLGLGPHKVVLVQVEREPVAPEVGIRCVWVPAEGTTTITALESRMSVTPQSSSMGELVEQPKRCVTAALLASVQVADHPQEHRRARRRAHPRCLCGVEGSRIAATSCWTCCRPAGVTLAGLPTIAYRMFSTSLRHAGVAEDHAVARGARRRSGRSRSRRRSPLGRRRPGTRARLRADGTVPMNVGGRRERIRTLRRPTLLRPARSGAADRGHRGCASLQKAPAADRGRVGHVVAIGSSRSSPLPWWHVRGDTTAVAACAMQR